MGTYCVWFVLLLTTGVNGFVFQTATNETKRQFTTWDDEELLIQLLSVKTSELQKIVQTGRKFLQKVRQWQGDHPAESRLARCVVRYCVDTKIPGMISSIDIDDAEDGRRGLSAPVWIEGGDDSLGWDDDDATSSYDDEPPFRTADDVKIKKLWKRKVVKALYIVYMHLRGIFSQYKLVNCGFYYILSKFFEWVDSAP